MHFFKHTPLALGIACAMMTTALQAKEWSTLSARATTADGYEVRANLFRVANVPLDYFDGVRAGASKLVLPLPDGGEVTFSLQEYALLPADQAAKFPEIMTFTGHNPASPVDTGRFDLGPLGFHAMFTHQGNTVFVDPLNDAQGYAIYYQHDAYSRLEEEADKVLGTNAKTLVRKTQVNGNERKRYTIAISAAGEYTQFHGGTKALATAAITTLLNRVNQVYQRDVGAEFQLATGNDSIIFTNPATDPFRNDSNDVSTNITVQAQAVANSTLGPFDIGHIVNTGGGGLAELGVLCMANKSGGMTGSSNPVGDAFFIDYVAHEIGHQFGAAHTFNGTSGSCGGGNREGTAAYEPGSGSSIMAYAGICGDENIQAHSDPYFHSKSIEMMRTHMATVPACGATINLTNNAPVAAAGGEYTIPANTPFVLKGSGTDLDNDPLTYTWEEIDLGSASSYASEMVDDGTRPLFRFVAPTSSSERILPSMSSLLAATLAIGEAWPTTNRDLNFRFTVRDGKGGVASDDMVLHVVNTGVGFQVTGPTSVSLLAGSRLVVAWNVAGTDQPPISCSKVDVFLSQNEGGDWTSLGAGLPNNGSTTVTLPASLTNTVRVKVACSDNIFFSISGLKQGTNGSSGNTGGNGGGGSLGFWSVALALLAWQRKRP